MPNGMLSDLEFENQLNELGDNQLELIKFVARQQFSSSKTLTSHDARIDSMENGNRKISGIIGAITGSFTGIIIGVISYFTNRN